MGKAGEKFEELVEIMEKLRGPDGCEWDRQQTHQTLKPYLIEEAYELLDAIDRGDEEEMIEELGDVLLQVVFHAQIAKENGSFDICEVIERLNRKLIRRHPHVFGNSRGYSYRQWEEIKSQEKKKTEVSRIGDFNAALPALSLARRLQENASAVGFDWKDAKGVLEKIKEEVEELEATLSQNGREEEFGDLLFSMVNLARFLNIDPEVALKKACIKFARRFRKMEELLEKDGKILEHEDMEILDEYWNRAKEEES